MRGTVPAVENEKTERCSPCLQKDYNTVQGDEHSESVTKPQKSYGSRSRGYQGNTKSGWLILSGGRRKVTSKSQSLTSGLETI